MNTVFDAFTMMIFAGLIVLFLQRSIGETQYKDAMWQYLVAAIGCAVANYLGNNGYRIPAAVLIVATLAFIFYVLRPFARSPQP
jgi:steroid 5-alpha reductase family enzyme